MYLVWVLANGFPPSRASTPKVILYFAQMAQQSRDLRCWSQTEFFQTTLRILIVGPFKGIYSVDKGIYGIVSLGFRVQGRCTQELGTHKQDPRGPHLRVDRVL